MIIAKADDSPVGLRDRLHDGQAQPAAPAGARGRCEADERMGQITVGEPRTMIMNLYLNGLASTCADQLNIPRTVCQCVVHEVAQGIFQTPPIRQDQIFLRLNRDRAPFQLCSTAATLGHLRKQIMKVHRLPVEAQPLFVRGC